MQPILLDIMIVAVVLLCVGVSYSNGFANSAVRLIGWVASLIAASILSTPVARWLYDNLLYSRVLSAVEEQISTFATSDELVAGVDTMLERLPAGLSAVMRLDSMDISGQIASLAGRLHHSELAAAIVGAVLEPAILAVLGIMIFFVLFTLFGVLVRIAASAMKLINKLPVVGSINAMMGAVIGVGEGIIFAYLIALGLHLCILVTGDSLGIVSERDITASTIFSYFYSMGHPGNHVSDLISSFNV